MYIDEESIDDLLNGVYSSLLKNGKPNKASKGNTTEQIGALLQLRNPRARLSASATRLKLFSALGEFVWYVAGSDDPGFIGYYIPLYKTMKLDGDRIPGAYGPRLFGSTPNDQFLNAIELLRQRPSSRRAVIQLYRAEDLSLSVSEATSDEPLDVPCTCTLQFFIRDDVLQLVVHMRSNDAYKGLPHDVFCFTMLQELAARSLGIEPGIYTHSVGSLHLYDDDRPFAKDYLDEGWHNAITMPPMPQGDQIRIVAKLVKAERQIRNGLSNPIEYLPIYWRDIEILLQAHSSLKRASAGSKENILREARARVSCDAFKLYLRDREHAISAASNIEAKVHT